MKCPKCKGEMEEGEESAVNAGIIYWCLGHNLLQVPKKRKDKISYRCKECGYLESYAK